MYVSRLTIIGSDDGLSPGRHQVIIWTNAGILLIGPLVTNFSQILNEVHIFSLKKMHFKMSSGKWRPFCFGLNVLIGSLSSVTAAVIQRVWSADGAIYQLHKIKGHIFLDTGVGRSRVEGRTASLVTARAAGERKTHYFNGLVRERHNSSVLAMELCLPCINHQFELYEGKLDFS